jgi:DNA invertase Pin-like site-specific DNA recombinase
MTEEQIKIIVEMYRDGRSYIKIAKRASASVYQVKRWVRLNRDDYELTRRRSLAEGSGVNSEAAEIASSWNIKASKRYLSMKWG